MAAASIAVAGLVLPLFLLASLVATLLELPRWVLANPLVMGAAAAVIALPVVAVAIHYASVFRSQLRAGRHGAGDGADSGGHSR